MTPKRDEVKAPPHVEDAARQRQVLLDLLELSSSCEQADRSIEHDCEEGARSINRRHGRLSLNLGKRHASAGSTLAHSLEQRAARLAADAQARRQRMVQDHEAAMRQLGEQAEDNNRRIVDRLQEAIWLADSIYEGAQITHKDDCVKLTEQANLGREALDELAKSVDDQLRRYRQAWTIAEVEATIDEQVIPDPDTAFDQSCRDVAVKLQDTRRLIAPMLLTGWFPVVALLLLGAPLGFVVYTIAGRYEGASSAWLLTWVIGLSSVVMICVGAATVVRWISGRQLRVVCAFIRNSLLVAERAAQQRLSRARASAEAALSDAKAKRDRAIEMARGKLEPAAKRTRQESVTVFEKLGADHPAALERFDRENAQALGRHEHKARQDAETLEARYDRLMAAAEQRRNDHLATMAEQIDAQRRAVADNRTHGARRVCALAERSRHLMATLGPSWQDDSWSTWNPPKHDAPLIQFGSLRVDMRDLVENGSERLEAPPVFDLPALMTFPERASILIRSTRQGRDSGVDLLRSVMLRLLTTLPPGQVRFTLIDPVGLGESFAGFMHLADADEDLVGSRIWSEPEHIEQRLADLTLHMEQVIQKYLRNEFDSIDRYNEQAGALAEPYRYVVIADLPTNLTPESLQRLDSILKSGRRCGVFTLILQNAWKKLPPGVENLDLEGHTVVLEHDGKDAVWTDPVYGRFSYIVDRPPPDALLTSVLRRIGEAAHRGARVEVPFGQIAPSDDQAWSCDCGAGLSVPIGKCGATRIQHLSLGKGVAQHVLITGKTGSGKSTLLHVLTTNLALWYGPDQVELYLVDFKKGVEFKCYARHGLPHARAIAIESDREFGLSVLQKLDRKMQDRGELFRDAGVQDLTAFRRARPQTALPRAVLLVDEFQELFTHDDQIAQQAGLLLDRLVRQGRAFGIHVILGTQTLAAGLGLPRGTTGQMAVRIALQCSEADSQLILNDDNTAARLLRRSGEALYNDAGGLVEGNSPFQVAWLPDDERDQYLELLQKRASDIGDEPPIVFEGGRPADIKTNRPLAQLLSAGRPAKPPGDPSAWLGEPVSIKAPTAAGFSQRSGTNLMIVGQQQDMALQVVTSVLVSLMAQHPTDNARFTLFDGSPSESFESDGLQSLAALSPDAARIVPWRDVSTELAAMVNELHKRFDKDIRNLPSIYLIVYGLQRFRVLRRSEEDLGFSMDQETQPQAPPDRQFAELIREGPMLGLHTIVWSDSLASIERALDRATLREFDQRVLFQVSADDSSELIETPEANRLGFYRAILRSDERGLLEKFRPYELPSGEWLKKFGKTMGGKGTQT